MLLSTEGDININIGGMPLMDLGCFIDYPEFKIYKLNNLYVRINNLTHLMQVIQGLTQFSGGNPYIMIATYCM